MLPCPHPWSVKYWTIRELLSAADLMDESNALRHCAWMYAEACRRRRTSLWSLSRHGRLESQRVVTIEVDPRTRKIVTARGRCNSRPRADAQRVLALWARHAGLKIAPAVREAP